VPRFFFDLIQGSVTLRDSNGRELADLPKARDEALARLTRAAAYASTQRGVLGCQLRDASGDALARVTLETMSRRPRHDMRLAQLQEITRDQERVNDFADWLHAMRDEIARRKRQGLDTGGEEAELQLVAGSFVTHTAERILALGLGEAWPMTREPARPSPKAA
jgi:hypothetical protein